MRNCRNLKVRWLETTSAVYSHDLRYSLTWSVPHEWDVAYVGTQAIHSPPAAHPEQGVTELGRQSRAPTVRGSGYVSLDCTL